MLIDKSFGTSGAQIVIEEFLEGEEVSIHAIVSNGSFICLSPSQDHKRIGGTRVLRRHGCLCLTRNDRRFTGNH